MDIKQIDALLVDHPFFEGLKPDYLELIAQCAKNVRYERGHFLFHEAGAAESFYLITRGKVALEIAAGDRGPITLHHLDPSDILGWSWMIPPYQWQFGALAVETTTAVSFDAKCIREKCDSDHSLGYELMRRVNQLMGASLQAARRQLLDYV